MTERTDGDGRCSRRSLLAGAGAAAVASTAGCLTTLPTFGQRIRYGDVEEPSVDSPEYRNWMPESSGGISYMEPPAWDSETLGPPDIVDHVKEDMVPVGVEFDSFDSVLYVDDVVVGRGEVDRSVAEETLNRAGYRYEDTTDGYDFYRGLDSTGTVAVGEAGVLAVPESADSSDPRAAIGEKLDANEGRIARKHEESWKFARLTEAVGGQPAVTAADSGALEFGGTEAVAQARGYTVEDGDAYVTMGAMSPEDETFDKSDIREFLSQFPEALDASRVDVRVDGRLATVVAKLTADVYRELVATYERPLSAWSVAYSPRSDTLTVDYDAGEAIDPAVLTTKYRGTNQEGRSFEDGLEPTPTQFEDEYDTVEPGASLTVDVSVFEEWTVVVEGQAPGSDYTWTEFTYNSTRIDE